MNSQYMVALVGEQPIPNLLPTLYKKPTAILLVYTSFTKKTSLRLEKVLKKRGFLVEFLDISDEYNLSQIYQELTGKLNELKWWKDNNLFFNITGGTKLMSIAAYQYATAKNCPLLYFQSQGNQSRLYQYNFNADTSYTEETLPALITLDDYLCAFLPGYQEKGFSKSTGGKLTLGGEFEQQIYKVLENQVDEIMAGVKPGGVNEQLEIDFVIRLHNQVGIIEAKTGKSARKKTGIDQLSTIGSREYLGIYTKKFLVVDTNWGKSNDLRELATARRVEVVELPTYNQTGEISDTDKKYLIKTIRTALGG